MTPAGAAALAALVNLPARPRVPASSGAAGLHDSPGAVRRAVLAGAVLVVLVVGNQLHRASVQTEPAGGDRTRPRFSHRRIRHATPWLKTTLVQAAWAATRKNGSYLQTQFRRLKGRRGPKKAIVAVAASMLTAAYFMLRDETDYHDLGGRYLANRDKHRVYPAPPPPSARPWSGGRSEGRLSQWSP